MNETNLSIATKEEKIAKKSGLNVGDNGIPRINSAEDWKAYDKAVKEIQAEKTNDIKISKNENVLTQITTNMAHKDFATALYARSKNDEAKTGIPPEIMTAQACLESGYGTSTAAVNSNNLFGLKPAGNIAKFASVEESIQRYEYVLTLSYYKDLYKSNDLHDWAFGIGPAGYCPDDNYGQALWDEISTLRKWGVFD